MEVVGFLCVSLGSSAVQLHDSLGSRRACACEAGLSSQKSGRAWGVYYRKIALYCEFSVGKKESMQMIFIKKYFLFTVGSACRVKWFTTGSSNCRLGGRCFGDEEVETVVQTWLRQQSKDFYAAGFEALVKRRDKCIYVGIINDFPVSNIICFTFYIHL
jgi:hypothetical protein